MFICMHKTHFIPSVLQELLLFKKIQQFDWQRIKFKNQNFARYEICAEILITTAILILDYFQKKLMIQFF